MTPDDGHVPLKTKLAYGLGAAAYGIKENGFATFLLLFYNQVVGLPAATVGLVIAAALIFDAFIDPFLGVMSDRTNTRWGRRHPWLYASVIPIAVSWVLLWHPPIDWSQSAQLAWLFATAIFTRAAIATNEVPSLALAPEMTRDYHERTSVIRYRYLFGWIGGLGFLMLAYGWFLAPPRGSQTGPLAVVGFGSFGWASALTMSACVFISAVATHKFVVSRALPPVERQTFAQTMAAVRQTLSNRAFLVLMLSGVLAYTAQGMNFSTSNYLLGFVWRLQPTDFLIYSIALFAGVVLAFLFVTPLGRALGKPRACALLYAIAALALTLPYLLRLVGLFPAFDDARFFPIFLSFCVVSCATGTAAFMTGASMMSDVVEASEEHTGRREEGLFFAGALFMQKCSSGIGILLTGLILQAASFPAGARPGSVGDDVLNPFSLIFCIVYIALVWASAAITLRFPFGSAEHDARLARLAAERG